ncbi:MAG: SH3 domain-containing protein, partial [Thermomicrobiales bacterium]|nr:SH3 domain-containing protein [Thermomicrobiales bacterium]
MRVRTRQVRQHGLAMKRTSRLVAALAMLVCIAVPTAGSAFAAPASSESIAPVADVNLGNGSYRVTASIFAEGTDGQVGTTASSGHLIQPNDNLVALPACTESSCPWVPVGTGVEGTYGPQTECAEADGLCWVQIVSETTGLCTVAPVHDRGPLFVRDNWWAPQNLREYNVTQGVPAAEYVRDGGNVGYGAGISDVGYDVRNVYTYAAGIDLAAGTWKALGLPVSAGITSVTVTMLWQAGVTHDQACGTAPPPQPTSLPTVVPTQPPVAAGNATVIDGALNLRSGPSQTASVVTVMPGNSRVTVTGGSQNGFYPVTYSADTGWAFGDYLDIDAGADPGPSNPAPAGDTATVIDGELNLRASASTNSAVLLVMPDSATVTLTGQSSNG